MYSRHLTLNTLRSRSCFCVLDYTTIHRLHKISKKNIEYAKGGEGYKRVRSLETSTADYQSDPADLDERITNLFTPASVMSPARVETVARNRVHLSRIHKMRCAAIRRCSR